MLKTRDANELRLQQIASIAFSEPIWSLLYFAHVGLPLLGGVAAIILFDVWWLAGISVVYALLFTMEKLLAASAYQRAEPSRYGSVLVLLTIRAAVYNCMVIAVWSADGDIFKMAALALLVAGTINIMVFHNAYFPVIACVVGPMWLGFATIASLFFVEYGPSPQSIAAVLVVLCVSPYFYLALLKARERISTALEARAEAEARFADLTEFSSEWFWEQDCQDRFTFFSDGFERATGIDPKTLLGRRRDEFSWTDEKALSESGVADVIKAIEARQPFHNFIYRAVDVRKNEMWVRTTGKPMFAADGEFQGYRGVAADVTKLYQAAREAKLASDAKSHFLTVVSHELRTPLTVLLGYNAFILKNETLPSVADLHRAVADKKDDELTVKLETALGEIASFSKKMNASGLQLLAIVSDLLDSTKMASDDFQMDFGRVDPGEDLDSILEHYRRLSEQKGLRFVSEIENAPLHADLTRLQQILSNLLSNAIKFTKHGSVSVHGQISDGAYQFLVHDTGIGMTHDETRRVFEPFYQADPTESRNHHGIGLGLAITKRLVQLHGGEISLETTQGEGSSFSFTVPIYELGLDMVN